MMRKFLMVSFLQRSCWLQCWEAWLLPGFSLAHHLRVSDASKMAQFLVAPTNVKGGGISFSGCIQLLGFCVFESCVGIFWPSIMKMRSQYIPEEARSTIMNFFRILLNIFVCIVLYNVSAFPMTVMFGMCSIFFFVASILQRQLADKTKMEHHQLKESEAEPLNV